MDERVEIRIAPRGDKRMSKTCNLTLHETGLNDADLMTLWDYPVDN